MFDPTTFDLILASVFAAAPVLTTAYWACAVVGVGLMLVSVLGGHDADGDVGVDFHGDVDVDAGAALDTDIATDVHVDVAADADAAGGVDAHVDGDVTHHADGVAAEASSLATWFSIRFVVFFVGVFGVLGLVLTYMTQAGQLAAFGVSLAGGVVAGQAVHQLLRRLRQTSGNTAPGLEDYVNKMARVTIPVSHTRKGEIALNVRGGQRYIPAISKHADATFNVGDQVAVVEYGGNAAEVVSRKEFEFLQDTQ
ncbi:MAG: hypothetical protein JXQ75_11745 [Phycisphaerae bacterium]|nr:hypothetical protein [Phycisphaerae bacterium]